MEQIEQIIFKIVDFIIKNKEWIFSGIGISFLGWIIQLIKKSEDKSISQNAGDNSIQISNSKDVKIKVVREDKNVK